MSRKTRMAVLTSSALLLAVAAPLNTATAAPDDTPRVDLRVLLVDDEGPATSAIADELRRAGTPYTNIDLSDPGRPVIDGDFLADTVDGRPRAKYQAVVLPNDNPFGAGSTELAALASYEKEFAVPQVDAYTYARPEVGLDPPTQGGYSGPLDGVEAAVTTAGRAGPFGYLDGGVPFEDISPTEDESYGYLARPAADADFTSYVDAPIPGSGGRGSLVGEYRHDGRRELVVTFAYASHQRQFQLLARGIVGWLTQDTGLGLSRNYFSVHIDDVYGADDRWDTELNCTPGDVDCQPDPGATNPIRMSPDDARHAADWSRTRGFGLDLAFNGGGSDRYREDNGGQDPLADQLDTDKNAFRWINHTYDHAFLGCVQDVSVVPWKCATELDGSTRYVGQDEISRQIRDNRAWGERAGLPLENGELVTGEHSGMRILPQQPDDNPHLAPALAENGIEWLGSDNSRDPAQRPVGQALTVPRHPLNIFYNVGREAEQIDEYNWLYTKAADGGSGICETAPDTTCLDAPLDPVTGYDDYIVPLEAAGALRRTLSNDPRPHYIHQSNLAEDRIAYPVLDRLLDDYAALYADNAPLVNPRQRAIGAELRDRAAWQAALDAGQVTAYRIGTAVTVVAPDDVRVPASMPNGTQQQLPDGGKDFGSPYAGTVSGWTGPATGQDRVTLTLPAAAPTGAADGSPAAPVQKPAPKLPVPEFEEFPKFPKSPEIPEIPEIPNVRGSAASDRVKAPAPVRS
ncbi:hypothetical protein U9R90_03835 [Streptomyces sp. E11-3]|uniref:hypothetical protein n=1 Tax=Streptomyces sp. E11-3 TaxID=3110112 RepID=UPI00398038A4